ncbi:hypothetical protein MXD81_45255 [Microbacteriaceae bacterium K1510]|nr:hypothetical protein [Microbacteriaceae bacterium K1510]
MPAQVAGESTRIVARGTADWLCLAATPTFAAMALLSGFSGGDSDLLCAAMNGASPLNGMAAMYALMAVFHLSPWLRLIAGWR